MREVKATVDNLNSIMEFDHVIRVNEDGTVSDVEESYYFDVTTYQQEQEGHWETSYTLPEGWSVMNGYSGQHGYSGPDMHQSEYIGGRMARDILETPGLYVALVVEADCGYREEDCNEEDGCQCEPDGWVVATLPAD
jgi:hypothetical protein